MIAVCEFKIKLNYVDEIIYFNNVQYESAQCTVAKQCGGN